MQRKCGTKWPIEIRLRLRTAEIVWNLMDGSGSGSIRNKVLPDITLLFFFFFSSGNPVTSLKFIKDLILPNSLCTIYTGFSFIAGGWTSRSWRSQGSFLVLPVLSDCSSPLAFSAWMHIYVHPQLRWHGKKNASGHVVLLSAVWGAGSAKGYQPGCWLPCT